MQRWVVQLERGRANKVTGRPCLQSVGARLDLGTETSPRQHRFDEANLPLAAEASEHTTGPDGSLQLWVRRVWVLLFVFVCATTGVLLLILPWRPEWTDNSLLFTFPSLRALVTNGFVRGLCSGLGMLDIWIGFSEAIHYHEINTN